MYDIKSFEHDGKEYEVRIASDGCTIHIRAFLAGEPANGYKYSVEVMTQINANMSSSTIDPAKELVKTAISDVKSGMWEQYIAAVSSTAKQNS